MTNDYTIKRFGNKGDYRLNGLQNVENFGAFVSEVNKKTRIWIDNLQVFATNEGLPSYGDYIRFKFAIDPEFTSDSLQFLVFYGEDVASLASALESVLCLPDSYQGRIIDISGWGENGNTDLVFSPAQLERILSAHESRSYMFSCFDLSPEQSLVLAKNNLEGIRFCSISDNGEAFVDYLEHHNEARTLGPYLFQFPNVWDKLTALLSRSTYPVFDDFFLDPYCRHVNRYALLAHANVKSITAIVNPYIIGRGEFEPLLHAIHDGTLVATKLRLYFDTSDPVQDEEELENYDIAIQSLFVAMCSADCQLKELHVHVKTAHIGTILLVGAEYLPRMLKINKSLETLGIEIPEPEVLDAVAEHPRIQKLVFVVPYNLDPFASNDTRELAEWFRKHPSHQIQYEHATRIFPHEGRRVVAKSQVETWHDFVFFSRFALLQKVKDERVRSYLLVTALANHSSSPQRVHFLLNGNLDIFAK